MKKSVRLLLLSLRLQPYLPCWLRQQTGGEGETQDTTLVEARPFPPIPADKIKIGVVTLQARTIHQAIHMLIRTEEMVAALDLRANRLSSETMLTTTM